MTWLEEAKKRAEAVQPGIHAMVLDERHRRIVYRDTPHAYALLERAKPRIVQLKAWAELFKAVNPAPACHVIAVECDALLRDLEGGPPDVD